MTPTIELDAVYAGYGKSVTLHDVTCAMESGEIWAICGPNGSGKSTMLRVICGLLRPTSGRVRLLGGSVGDADRVGLAKKLSLVPQDVEIAFDFTAREVVEMGRTPHGSPWRGATQQDTRAVDREIERFSLEMLSSTPVNELSGGERKRVALARAFAQEPSLLLLDEPTSSLDVKHEARLFSTVKELAATSHATVVLVLHDFAAASRAASHALLLAGGRVVGAGEAATVLAKEKLSEAFGVELETREVLVAKSDPAR